MASTRREGLASALRAARTHQGGTPSHSPSDSQSTPASSRRPRRIVGTSTLRSKPTSTVNAPTAFDYFNDPDVLTTTPVEEGREDEYIEQLAYAFQYGSDLLSFLKSTGLKMPTGYTLDTTTADMDFNALLSGLAHVLYPVSYSEAAKLLDLEHDHDFYHVTINEILFSILPHPLRGNALSVYHECARHHPADGRYALQRLRYEVEGVPDADGMRFWTQMRAVVLTEIEDPAPQLALIRRLGDRHQKLKPAYSDPDRVMDLWHILSESAKQSPYVAPLYLVVLRELRAGAVFTFARLALRIRLAFRDESPLATLSSSAAPDIPPEGSGYRPKQATLKPNPSPRSPVAMALRMQKQSAAPLEGKWTSDSPNSMYLKWVGTGFPCTVCFRMWHVTDSHPDTRGACPYVCVEAFANNRHLETSRAATARPPLNASAAALTAPPPAVDPPAPPEEQPAAAALSARLSLPAPVTGDAIDTVGSGSLVVPTTDDAAYPLPEDLEEPACYGAAFDGEDDTDWPAFRSSPVWLPNINGSVSGEEPKP
ncbi:hypothetical protein CYMTET_49248 [Cymbomonas tetramitiformis]|uniref:Uncharacterized protein n=1 Tax=Cymbomonas tetramitiformis TaxID=36881 RepID=A0AAE0BQP1_9CHLO|nr:hypothetical protein CYMTET_49248 [Cymbomonas tetramitiformis]